MARLNVSMIVSHSRRGFTLTEIAIVLGIVGLILGAIWTAAAHVYQQKKVNQEVQDIQDIVQSVRSLYATRGVIGAVECMNTLLVNSGSLPSNIVTPGPAGVCGAAVHNSWGESVDVGSQTGWGGLPVSPNDFEILVGFPQQTMSSAECVAVLSSIAGSSAASNGLTEVSLGPANTLLPIAAITDPSALNPCANYVTLQFSLK